MKKFINKPQNWQDFEDVCHMLYGYVWGCPDTIRKNGRQGTNQHGVDVYGIPKGYDKHSAIQCKGKDDWTDKNLTVAEIDREIARALTFHLPIEKFIFATTGNYDDKIQKYIDKLDLEYRKSHQMEIHVKFWNGIADLMYFHDKVLNWYERKEQKDYNVDVFFANGTQESTMEPVYDRHTTRWTDNYHYYNEYMRAPFRPRNGIFNNNRTWCDTMVLIKNTGASNLQNYRAEFIVEGPFKKMSDINNPPAFFQKPTHHEHPNKIIYTGEKVLLQGASTDFQLYIQPKDEKEYDLPIKWEIKADGLRQSGELLLKIRPKFIDTLEVYIAQPGETLHPEQFKITEHKD